MHDKHSGALDMTGDAIAVVNGKSDRAALDWSLTAEKAAGASKVRLPPLGRGPIKAPERQSFPHAALCSSAALLHVSPACARRTCHSDAERPPAVSISLEVGTVEHGGGVSARPCIEILRSRAPFPRP